MNNLKADIHIYPLTIGQKVILMDCLLYPQSRIYTEQLIVKIHGNIDVQDIIRAWSRIFTKHTMLGAIVKWDKIKQPVIITRRKTLQMNVISLSDKPICEMDKIIKERANWNWNHLVNINQNSFHVTILTGGVDHLFLIIDFHHLFIDGWSLLLILNEFIEFIGDKQEPCFGCVDQYEEYIRYYLRESAREEPMSFWGNYLQLKAGKEINEKQKSVIQEIVQKEYRLPQEIIERWMNKIRAWNVTFSAFVYYLWASVLKNLFHMEEIVFGITASGRNIPLDAVKSIVGMLINTMPLIVDNKILNNFSIADAINFIMSDVNDINKYALSFYPYIKKNKIQLSRLFGSVVIVQNYPGLRQNSGYPIMEYMNRRFLNNNSLSFSVRHQYENIYFDFGYDKNLYTDELIQNIYNFIIHLIQVN